MQKDSRTKEYFCMAKSNKPKDLISEKPSGLFYFVLALFLHKNIEIFGNMKINP